MDIKIYGVDGNVLYYWLVYQGEAYVYSTETRSVYLNTYKVTLTLLESLTQDVTLEFIENFQYNDIVEAFNNFLNSYEYSYSSINSTL